MDGGSGKLESLFAPFADAIHSFAEAASDPELLGRTIVKHCATLLDTFCGIATMSEDGVWLMPLASADPDEAGAALFGRLIASVPARVSENMFGPALASGTHVFLPALSDAVMRQRFGADYDAVARLEPRSLLWVPLRARGSTIGLMGFLRHGPKAEAFNETEVRLGRILAEHAAANLANARLLAQRERDVAARALLAARRGAVSTAARQLASASGDVEHLVSLIARTVSDVFADLCIVRRAQADDKLLPAEGIYHPDPSIVAAAREATDATQEVDQGVAGSVFTSGSAVLVEADSPEMQGLARGQYRSFVERVGMNGVMIVPLTTQDRVVGVISVCRTKHRVPFTPDDLALLQDLGAHASVALMNGELLARSRRELAERTRTEEVLRRGFLDAAPDAVLIANEAGEIILANVQAETLFGYSRTELIGFPIDMLVPDRFRDAHAGRRAGYSRKPLTRPMGAGVELYARRKDGSEFAAEIMLSPIETAHGGPDAAAVRDVTERRREMDERNQRMEEANRLKSEFLANMSHELRTPLNAIIGFAALMHGGKAGALAGDQREYLGDILTSARHLLQLINDILDLAKVESGKMDLHFEAVDFDVLVREVRDIVRGLAAEKKLRITIAVDPAASSAEVDARMVKQVLYNYLSNAIKFTPENGAVAIRILPLGDDEIRVDVEDTGIGISPEDIHRLFIEFQQLEAATTKRFAGTGLGLALVKRIVEAHRGRVEVKSEPGKGSTFTAIFPRRHLPTAEN